MAPTRRCPVLPDEIISDEIIARLPAKAALGCRRLSRAWAATIASDDFIDCYHALHAGRPKILRLQDDSHGDVAVDESAQSSRALGGVAITGECFPRYVTAFWDEPPVLRYDPSAVTTHCRGLILLELIPTGIHFLCNPSTGQKRALPEGRTTGCRDVRKLVHEYASLGLGYDDRARRHKVVRVYYRGRDSEGRPASSMGCEVYTVNDRDDESWRPVSSRPAGWVAPYKPSVFAQGHVYWLAHRKYELHDGYYTRQGRIIVSFSISEETFGTVAPPPAAHVMDDKAPRRRCLTELGGRLCLFSWGSPGSDEHRYDVWRLQSSGPTWDLYCRIETGTTSPEVNRVMRCSYGSSSIDFLPLVIIDNGHRILLARNDFPTDIWVYTPSTGDIQKHLDLMSMVDQKNSLLEVAVYEENIACPGRSTQPPSELVLTSSMSTQALSLLLRLLPERTLRRLMCVCRSWCTLIAMHLFNIGPSRIRRYLE